VSQNTFGQQDAATVSHPQLSGAQGGNPIDVCGLNMYYKESRVLKDVNLQIPHGAVVGLVGANGAGKTTLMRCLLGLSLPQSGHIRLLGDTPGDFSDGTRERLGYVAQIPELIEWMKLGQYLDYIGAFYPKWQARRVAQLVSDWVLNLNQKISQMSLGQKQKVALLQALGHTPDLLLLDEPVASLDPLMRRDFMRTLFEDAPDRTVLISSHLLSDLERIITHLVLMKDGRILLADEWDVLAESLQRVQLTHRLPDEPGVLAQHVHANGVTAVIDTRHFDMTSLPTGVRPASMNLDALFVELVS
jgi:ABC-2 type transport system ATP-binding protein